MENGMDAEFAAKLYMIAMKLASLACFQVFKRYENMNCLAPLWLSTKSEATITCR